MHLYIIYAHPSRESFCRQVLDHFTRGLESAGHTWESHDLSARNFSCLLSEKEYQREVGGDPSAPVPDDVKVEQGKIDHADALVFIYPVWWSDCPAILKGWFDRILTYGYAYHYDDTGGRHTRVGVDRALVICSAGHTEEHLEQSGIAEAMRRIMIDDRLRNVGITEADMVILGGMMPGDDRYRNVNLNRAWHLGAHFDPSDQ